MRTIAYMLHALSPLHAGTGHAAGIIDLPIARMKATGIPIVPSSSIKGVLRDARRPPSFDEQRDKSAQENEAENGWLATFGPDGKTVEASEHGGALIAGDARLFALPVRSFRGTFVWVTSPLLLRLAHRDLGLSPDVAIPNVADRQAAVTEATATACCHGGKLYLEDLDLIISNDASVGPWANRFARHVGEESFRKRFAVVDDDTMSFLYETATQIDQRIRIDPKTRTVVEGALWIEESLPPETLLIGLFAADRGRRPKHSMAEEAVIKFALPDLREQVLQFGGKATVGRGRCRLIPLV